MLKNSTKKHAVKTDLAPDRYETPGNGWVLEET